MSVAIGTRVKWNGSTFGDDSLTNGDLGTVVGLNQFSNETLYIRMDEPRGQRGSTINGDVRYHWSGTIGDQGFLVVEALSVGDTATIVADTDDRDPHNLPMGTAVTVKAVDVDAYGRYEVTTDRGWGYFVTAADLGQTAPAQEPVTLEQFKITFLEGALERGRLNGVTHEGQVREALNRLAGLEYLEPSKTLEDFQKRVVTLAMEKKSEHNWCGEPEAYLMEIGLGHLVPQTKEIQVVMTVSIQVPPGASRAEQRRLARAEAERLVTLDGGISFHVPTGEYNINNEY